MRLRRLRGERSIADIIFERRSGPRKDPAEAAASYVYVLARDFLQREVRRDRKERVLRDFEEAARAITDAASGGASWGEQAEILRSFCERFNLPDRDLRKRREKRGPTAHQLRSEVDALREQLRPILRSRKKTPRRQLVQALRDLAPWATLRALEDAADNGPTQAAYVLSGSRHHLGAGTIRNLISKDRKRS